MMTDQSSPDIVERLRDRDAVVMSGLFHAIPTMREAADEIERLRNVAQAVPEGWKLVPIKPTAEMIETGCDNNPTMFNEGTDNGFAADVANDVYVAMVRAAPALSSAERPDACPQTQQDRQEAKP